MAQDFRIWRAGPGDVGRVLAAAVFDGPAAAGQTARFLGEGGLADPRTILILAEAEGVAVGFVSGAVLDHPDKPRELFVQELGVNEAARRRGIATALIAAIRAEGRALGAVATWVLTEAGNLPARALYAAAGAEDSAEVVMFAWDETGASQAPLRPPAPDR